MTLPYVRRQSCIRIALRFTVVAMALLPAACATTSIAPVALRDRHGYDVAFYRGLLSGRVWVNSRANLSGWVFSLEATYYGPDGRMLQCSVLHEMKFQSDGIWHVVANRLGVPLLKEISENSLPEPEHAPLYYEPKRKRLFVKTWTTGGDGWVIGRDGWVQDSFPLALKLLCPDLDLPAELAINEKQTGSSLRELRQQDPDAAILRSSEDERP